MATLDCMSDEDLVIACRSGGNTEISVLISRYERMIRSQAAYYAAKSSAEADDLTQEGLLAFIKAVSTYKNGKNASFSTYANVCISNKIKSALHRNKRFGSETDISSEDELMYNFTPETIYFERERTRELYDKISQMLSECEWEIFQLYLKGTAYNDMAEQLGVSQKAIDNALQRVRRKLKTLFRQT